MAIYQRYKNNPVLLPKSNVYWERLATFNACPIKDGDKIHLLYRAMSDLKYNNGAMMNVSSVAYACGDEKNGFYDRVQLVKPEEDWEKFGCEDPRITKLGDKYFIFYTALSSYPFTADGIKIGVAVTTDFKNIEKHQVTTFNSKAMALFSEKINGKIVAILTANTEKLPADIALAYFDKEEDIWSKRFWNDWYENIDKYKLNFSKREEDHIEIGAPPLKTEAGWLLLYSYIKNYSSKNEVVFQVKAVLLDKDDPSKIIGESETLMQPEESYEIYGQVPNVIFPSGAYIEGNDLHLYYGATDTTCCGVKFKLDALLKEIMTKPEERFSLTRYVGNPILKPTENVWEAKAVFNAAAIYLGDKFHIVYRAMAHSGDCVFGYASSLDGFHIDERLSQPIYVPRKDFEMKKNPGFGYAGCEDPRLIIFEGKLYMFYTAYDGVNHPRVAISSIEIDDFLNKRWNWEIPKIISPLTEFNKNACIFPQRVNGNIIALHRMNNSIDIQFIDDLNFESGELGIETNWIIPRRGMWDCRKVGITGPPIKTEHGWLLIYHGVSRHSKYRLGAILLDLENPEKIIARTDQPILEPLMDYEIEGQIRNVVFSCGVVLKDGVLYVYYGGGDTVLGVATAKLDEVIALLQDCVYE